MHTPVVDGIHSKVPTGGQTNTGHHRSVCNGSQMVAAGYGRRRSEADKRSVEADRQA